MAFDLLERLDFVFLAVGGSFRSDTLFRVSMRFR